MAVPVELEIFIKNSTNAGLQSVGNNVSNVENQTQQLIAALKQVIAEQKKQLEANRAASQNYTQEAANIQALTGRVRELEAGLKSLQKAKKETTENKQKVDIDTTEIDRKTNYLKLQFAQVARELPSLAMGPQMFILAISNNFPMLMEAIANVRKENELLTASGKKAVPVWKQLASALFSPQTALIVAITLMIAFHKEIGNLIGKLTSSRKELSEMQKNQESLNKVQVEGGKAALEESNKLRILYEASQDTTKSMKDRNKAVDELQKMYPSYFSQMSNEEILAGKASDAYQRLTQSIISSAKARAAMNKMVEEQGKILENEQKINDAYSRLNAAENNYRTKQALYDKGLQEGFGTATAKIDAGYALTMAKVEVEKIYKEIAGYRSAIYESNKLSKELERSIKVEDLVTEGGGGTGTGLGKTDYASQLADARVKAQQTTEKLRLQIMVEGIAKRKALARLEYDEQLADIEM